MLNSYYWSKRDSDNLQPDISLIVGGPQNAVKFFAHKFVLSKYSGYFKTLLSTYKGFEVHISNINSHTFAYLLTFMYTGYLDLNALNVYEIFLASNLLHITDALNLCRQYLAESQNHPKSVVKPIPRKKTAASAFNNLYTLKYQPLRINNDQVSSIFKPVRNIVDTTVAEPDQPETVANPDAKLTQNENDSKKADTPTNIILDVACCDGPIKFRKVVNKFYDPDKANHVSKDECKSDVSIACHGCKHVFKNYHKFKRFVTSSSILQASSPGAENKCKKKPDNSLQCYTCKTCGSKFPSYYFVHKHRKLHHAEERESSEQNT